MIFPLFLFSVFVYVSEEEKDTNKSGESIGEEICYNGRMDCARTELIISVLYWLLPMKVSPVTPFMYFKALGQK